MRVVRPRRIVTLVAVAALGALSVAWSDAWAQSQPARTSPLVKLSKTALGSVLADGRGHTLYLYAEDRKNTSTCYGKCATFWPPLLTSAKARAGLGAKASLLGVAMRKDGKHQVTYAGHPLYFFAEDKKAGQVNGLGIEKAWWAISSTGARVTKKPAAKPQPTPKPQQPATVELRTTSAGAVLVDAKGVSLYLFTPDNAGSSTCNGQCAATWPPLLASGKLVAGKGLDQSLLGTTQRTDGTTQVTYAGHPLYYFAKDAQPGDTNGEAVGGVWFLVSPSGDKVDTRSDSASSGSGGGYGGGY
jgi:predicted lipoprotein with Yx(FWY)xxD motif